MDYIRANEPTTWTSMRIVDSDRYRSLSSDATRSRLVDNPYLPDIEPCQRIVDVVKNKRESLELHIQQQHSTPSY